MRNLALIGTLFVSACAGYTALYDMPAESVVVAKVAMEKVEKNVGERRVAQRVSQRLRRAFPDEVAAYRLETYIEETQSTLAVRRNATVERSQVNLAADVLLFKEDGSTQPIFQATLSAASAYNVESSPYSTEAGRVFARQAAADTLGDEIVRMVKRVLVQQGETE